MKKILKKIFIGVGICFGLILLFLIGVFSYFGTGQAQGIIQARLNKAIPGQVSWDSFHFSILAGRFEVNNFLLKGIEDEKLTAIDRVFLNLSWTDLIQGNIHIEKIEIESPQIRLSKDNDGRLNLMKAFPQTEDKKDESPKQTSMPFNIVTNEIKITNGFFQYEEAGKIPTDKTAEEKNGQIVIQDINLNSNNGNLLEKSGHLALNIGKGNIDMPGIKTDLGSLSIEAVLNKGKLEPVKVSLDSKMADVDISGNVDEILSKPEMDIDLKLETSLADIRKILNLKPELTGNIKINIKGLGNPENPETRLGFQYSGGILAGNRVDKVNLECTMKDRLVSIEKLDINTPQGNLDLNGEINLQQAFAKGFLSPPEDMEAISYKIELVQTNTNLKEVPGQKDQFAGNIHSNLKLQGKGISLENIAVKAVVEIFGEKIVFKDVLKQTDLHLLTHAAINKKQVKIEKLDLNAGSINLGVKGDYNIISQKILANIALDLPDLSKPFSIPSIKNISGNLNVNADISGNLKQILADLSLKGTGLGINDISIGDLNLNAGLDKTGQVSVKSLTLDNQGSSFKISGVIQALQEGLALDPNLRSDLSLVFQNIESKDFTAKEIFSGDLNGTLAIKGPLKNPKAVLELQGNNLGFEANRIGSLNTSLSLADGTLNLQKLNVQNGSSEIFLSGTAKILDQNMKPLKNPEFDFKLDNTTLIASDFSDSLYGEVELDAKIQGSLSAPEALINLKGKDLASGDNRIGNIEAALRFSEDTLFIDPVKVKNGKSGLNISGKAKILDSKLLKPLKDPEFDLNLKGEGIFLEDFVKTMKGRVVLKGHVYGSMTHPEGSITLNGKKIDLGVQKIEGIKLASNLDGEQVNIESFLIAMAPGEEIVADGWVSPVKKIYELRMKSKGISLKNIDSLKNQKLGEGKISLDLAGKGSFENPQLNGDVNISGLRVNDRMLQDLKIRVDIKDQVANISGNFNFDLNAKYHLKTKEFSAKLLCDKTDLAPFFKIGGKENLSGTLTGTIEAKGNADAPDKIQAVADIKHMSVFMDKKELIKADNFTASFKNQEIMIPGIRLSLLEQGNLDISGKGNIKGPLDLKAEGNIPMQIVRAFAEDIQDLTGNLKISAILKGSPDNPDLRADLILDALGMSIPGIEQRLNSLNGQIKITRDQLKLKDVWGMLDKGRFDLDGEAVLKNFNPEKISVKLRAHALPVDMPDMLETLLNTELLFSGTPDKSSLTGEITILEGRYYKDVKMNLLENVGKKTRSETAPPSKQTQPFLKNMNLNIKVKSRQPFVVDNNMALISLKPDLRIQGDLNNIRVEGRAETEPGGIITYQKKDFEVQKGIIDFLNPYKIEPTLDIKSQTAVRTWTIFLSVSGTPDNLVMKLSSNPHEEDGDIISLLALGKTTRELVQGEGGTSTSTKQMLANIVADTLQKNLKDATGLDIIEMEYSEGGSTKDDTDDIKVTVGKELSRRMTVKYGVETKDGVTVQQAITEYKFFENLLMKAFQDTEGDFGGELVFRLEFR